MERILAGLLLLALAGPLLGWLLTPRLQIHGAREVRIWMRRCSTTLRGSWQVLPFWTRLSGVVLRMSWEEPSCGPCHVDVTCSYAFPAGGLRVPVAFTASTTIAGSAVFRHAAQGTRPAAEIAPGIWFAGDAALRDRLLAEEFRKRAVLQALEAEGSRLSLRSGQARWELKSRVNLAYHGPRLLETARKLAHALQA